MLIETVLIYICQVGLLDPRWVEERDKNMVQKAREEVKVKKMRKLLSSIVFLRWCLHLARALSRI